MKKYFKISYALVILRPIKELLEVNNNRKGSKEYIPEGVFKRILGRFQLPTIDEGWDYINFKIVSSQSSFLDSLFNYEMIEDLNHDNPHHPESLKDHINFCVDYCKEHSLANILVELSQYHDVGKFFVKQYNEEKGYSQYIGHAALSAYIYLVDACINYLNSYNKQQDLSQEAGYRMFDLYQMSNVSDILIMYYLIYYHDQPFACGTKEHLIHSLAKPSKPLHYLQQKQLLDIEFITDLLIGFNHIDRLRENIDE